MARSRRYKQTRKYVLRFVLVALLLVVACLAWMTWIWWDERRPAMIRYPEFGIPIPTRYSIHGIDVSRYQENISWDAVQEMDIEGIRIGFVFIKATEGLSSVDPKFRRNWTGARKAGITRGAYHFFLAGKSGRAQAEQFIRTVPLEPGDLPPVVDIESAGRAKPEAIRKELKIWLDSTEQHYGVRPVIYTYLNFYEHYLQGYFDDYPLWVAHYLQPEGPRIERPWAFWQHSEQGHVDGIRSRVDFDVFSGDSLSFRALLVP
ncbi:glycoside hydrolase family 25 protein [Flaviaesturariibacter terrae]